MWGYVLLILIFICTDVAFWLNLAYLHGYVLTNMSLLNKYIQKIKKIASIAKLKDVFLFTFLLSLLTTSANIIAQKKGWEPFFSRRC